MSTYRPPKARRRRQLLNEYGLHVVLGLCAMFWAIVILSFFFL